MKFIFTTSIGFFLLAVYLILQGCALLIAEFALPPIILGILALVSGICILIGK